MSLAGLVRRHSAPLAPVAPPPDPVAPPPDPVALCVNRRWQQGKGSESVQDLLNMALEQLAEAKGSQDAMQAKVVQLEARNSEKLQRCQEELQEQLSLIHI